MILTRIYENNQFHDNLENNFLNLLDAISRSNAHNAAMYRLENYKLENHLRIDGIFENQQCIAFAGVYRDSAWPVQVYRTHSRLWIDRRYRQTAFTPPLSASQNELSNSPEPSFIAKYLIGPVHRELTQVSKALFVSFLGAAEIDSINIIQNTHKLLWNDNLNWQLQENVLVNNESRTIIYANIEQNYNLLDHL